MFVHPLIALERHEVTLEPRLLARARRELLAERDRGAAFRSGYVLGVDAAPPPACVELVQHVQAQLGAGAFTLSFLKLAVGTPPATSDGPFAEMPHLDSHPQLTGSTELLRLLVNLSTQPRRFLYALVDRLPERSRTEFAPLRLPTGTETRVVVIPGRTPTTVHALRFYASAIPHVGLNDPPEHFLLSFERLVSGPRPPRS